MPSNSGGGNEKPLGEAKAPQPSSGGNQPSSGGSNTSGGSLPSFVGGSGQAFSDAERDEKHQELDKLVIAWYKGEYLPYVVDTLTWVLSLPDWSLEDEKGLSKELQWVNERSDIERLCSPAERTNKGPHAVKGKWRKVGDEGNPAIEVPIGSHVRYGSGDEWVVRSVTSSPLPCPGRGKVVEVFDPEQDPLRLVAVLVPCAGREPSLKKDFLPPFGDATPDSTPFLRAPYLTHNKLRVLLGEVFLDEQGYPKPSFDKQGNPMPPSPDTPCKAHVGARTLLLHLWRVALEDLLEDSPEPVVAVKEPILYDMKLLEDEAAKAWKKLPLKTPSPASDPLSPMKSSSSGYFFCAANDSPAAEEVQVKIDQHDGARSLAGGGGPLLKGGGLTQSPAPLSCMS